MRKVLSIVLAGLLVILPVEQVLAQASHQVDVGVQQTAPSDPAARLFRVPPLTENSARLLSTSSEGALLESSLSTRDAAVGWSDWSNGKRALVVVGAIVAAVVVFAVFLSDFGCEANCITPS